MDVEKLAREISILQQDSNCGNPAKHWDNPYPTPPGQMSSYSPETRDKYREKAGSINKVIQEIQREEDGEVCESHYVAAFALVLHTYEDCGFDYNWMTKFNNALDYECVEQAEALYVAWKLGALD